jgi:hypothetical protein
MTPMQVAAVANFLGQYQQFIGHHGLCIGADVQFDGLARAALGFEHMVIHPMAYAGPKRGSVALGPGDLTLPECPPLVRNAHIAGCCDVLLATPKEDHMVVRSGTWTTVRYALSNLKPVFIVIPSGLVIPWV